MHHAINNALISLSPLIAQNKPNIEIEVRFQQPITRNQFSRLKSWLQKRYVGVDEYSEDARSGDIRRIHYPSTDIGTGIGVGAGQGITVWQRKKYIKEVKLPDYGIRIVLNTEETILPVPDFKQEKQRCRDRTKFVVNKSSQVDVTRLSCTNLRRQDNTSSYEVEVEFTDPAIPIGIAGSEGAVKDFIFTVNSVWGALYDTNIVYSVQEKDFVTSYMRKSMTSPLTRARNLKLSDMVWGGLIGGKFSYRATIKTDGIRKILVIDNNGSLWLNYPPIEYNLVLKGNQILKAFSGTILDGELVPPEQRRGKAPQSSYWFLPFDVLCYKGNCGIQTESHDKRIQAILPLIHALESKEGRADADAIRRHITISMKDFYDLNSVDRFYYIMNTLLDLRKKGSVVYHTHDDKNEVRLLNYKDDGLVFIPRDAPYDFVKEKAPLKNRTLSRYPDICKWKPASQLAIDFRVKMTGDRIDLYAANDIKFEGSDIMPYRGEIDSKSPLLNISNNNTIIEVAWDISRGMFIPIRERWVDKLNPNPIDVAIDNWNLIFDPITEETLRGNTFALVRKYHNRIKRNLLATRGFKLPGGPGQSRGSGRTLLDIGSGRGGDISKWSNYDIVIAVEPNAEHRKEFQRRLAISKIKTAVHLIPAEGQDTKSVTAFIQAKVPGGKVDDVSLMLSMTFFWKDEETLQSLLNTIITNIKPGGTILFLTMNGDTALTALQSASLLRLGPAVLTYKGPTIADHSPTPASAGVGELLHIDIKDSIVTNQDEYLVHLDQFYKGLGVTSAQITQIQADEEKFLSNNEYLYTRLYTYGIIKYSPSREGEYKAFFKIEAPWITVNIEKAAAHIGPLRSGTWRAIMAPPTRIPDYVITPLILHHNSINIKEISPLTYNAISLYNDIVRSMHLHIDNITVCERDGDQLISISLPKSTRIFNIFYNDAMIVLLFAV